PVFRASCELNHYTRTSEAADTTHLKPCPRCPRFSPFRGVGIVNTTPVPDLASGAVVAQHLGIRPSTVERLYKAGKIPAVRLGPKLIRYRLEDVRAAIASMSVPATAPSADRQPVGAA